MRVIVAGAGLAGLRCAQLLKRGGCEVLVYEARERVGGRLWTRETDEGYFEAGGEWVDADHARVLGLIKELGLEPEESGMWPGWGFLGDKKVSEDDPGADASADAERVETGARRLCAELGDPVWETSYQLRGRGLDEWTLGEWLDLVCETKEGREWQEMTLRSDEGEDTANVGLLGWLWAYRQYLERSAGDMSSFRVPGGAGQMCETMAEELGESVLLGKPLHSVEVKEDYVEAWFEGEMAFGDRLVVALPVGCLPGVEWPLDFPSEAVEAWEAVSMARAIKVVLRFKSKWWEGTDWSGRAIEDSEFQQAWIGGREGEAAVACYICGDRAEEVLDSDDPVGLVLESFGARFPEAVAAFESGEVVDWVNDEFADGAFPSLPPGSVTVCRDLLGKSFGPVHFAGDYSSEWLGFMEGALESAERVAKEILG